MNVVMQYIELLMQPMALPWLVASLAFLVGIVRPWSWFRRRDEQVSAASLVAVSSQQDQAVEGEQSHWLEHLVLFLPRVFIDILEVVHTKRFRFYGLVLALLSIEAFFAFRASVVYYDVLQAHVPWLELTIVCIIVFIAIFLSGYMVATAQKKEKDQDGKEKTSISKASILTAALVVFHDWAGTIYMNYSGTGEAAQAVRSISASTDVWSAFVTNVQPLKMLITFGMCALGLLPFVMGRWAEQLRPEMADELEDEINEFTDSATRRIKRRAINMVLRRVSRTDVTVLVQALPQEDFEDFKSFVLPIIAPGEPHNLTEKSPAIAQELTVMFEANTSTDPQSVGRNTDPLPVVDPAEVAATQLEQRAPLEAPLPVENSADQDDESEVVDDLAEVVARYPIVGSWRSAGRRSVSIKEVIQETGHSAQLIHNRVKDGTFQKTRRPGHLRIDSVVEWLKSAPYPKVKEAVIQEDTMPVSPKITQPLLAESEAEMVADSAQTAPEQTESYRSVEENQSNMNGDGGEADKLAITLELLKQKGSVTDAELAQALGLKRSASARMWRIKAQDILNSELVGARA